MSVLMVLKWVLAFSIAVLPIVLFQFVLRREYRAFASSESDKSAAHSLWYYWHKVRKWRATDLLWFSAAAVWFPIGLGLGLSLL